MMIKTDDKTVIRYVVTCMGRDGMRVLAQDCQGRYTYATLGEAADMAAAISGNNSRDNLAQVFGEQAIGTFEARACRCWPVHFDPKGIYFDE